MKKKTKKAFHPIRSIRISNEVWETLTKNKKGTWSYYLGELIKCNTKDKKCNTKTNEVMNKFKKLTPSLSFGNKTQRKACEEMFEQFGEEETLRMVDMVLSVQGIKYAPRATTPHAMWQKIGDFKAYFETKKEVKNKTMSL